VRSHTTRDFPSCVPHVACGGSHGNAADVTQIYICLCRSRRVKVLRIFGGLRRQGDRSMMKWSPRMGARGTKKLHVKVNQLKLEVIWKGKVEDDKIVVAEMKWRGPPKPGVLAPFYRTSTCQRNYTGERCLGRGKPVQWNSEFDSVCSFSVSNDGSLGPWNVSFKVLHVSFFFFSFLRCLIFFLFLNS
jgi:hypothetical protein